MAQRDDTSRHRTYNQGYNAQNTAGIYPVWNIPASARATRLQLPIGIQRQQQNGKCLTANEPSTDGGLQNKKDGLGNEGIGMRPGFVSQVDARAKALEVQALSNEVCQALQSSRNAVDAAKKKMEDFSDRYTSSPYIRVNQRLAYLNKLMELENIVSEMSQHSRSMHFLRLKSNTWMAELRKSTDNQLGDKVEEITSFAKKTEEFKTAIQVLNDEADNAYREIEKILPRPPKNVLTTMMYLILRLWDGIFP